MAAVGTRNGTTGSTGSPTSTGLRTPHRRGTVWPARVDQHLDEGVERARRRRWVQSACLLCSNGCGCDIAVKDGRMVGVRGRGDRRGQPRAARARRASTAARRGRHSPDRLTRPLVREGGRLVETDWDDRDGPRSSSESKRLLDEKGPLSHGFYTRGQLFLEEYYTLAVIGKAGLGTPHMDGNTRLCTATARRR